jgi:soluble lytic murein transglycosylase-like protein
MRWVIRTAALLTVVSWIVVQGLFARPAITTDGRPYVRPAGQPVAAASKLPADWMRRVAASSREAFPGVPPADSARVLPIVERHASRFRLDPLLVLAVIQVESRFDPTAVSSRGAMGLMQLRGETARELAEDLGLSWRGDEQLFDPETNVMLGCAYLSRLNRRFGGVDAALAAYSSGPSIVEARLDTNSPIPLGYTDRVWDVLVTLQSKVPV